MTTENERNGKLVSELAQFSGTTQYYRFSPQLFPYFLLTDGTEYLANEAGCYWLFVGVTHYPKDPACAST